MSGVKGKEKRGLTIKELKERTDHAGQIKDFDSKYQTLRAAFQRGMDDIDAIMEARMNPDTFYRWCRESDDFKYEMEWCRGFIDRMAERKSAEFVEAGDKQHIQWILERRKKAKYSTRVETTGAAGGAVEVNLTNLQQGKIKKMTDEELQRFIAEQVHTLAAGRGR